MPGKLERLFETMPTRCVPPSIPTCATSTSTRRWVVFLKGSSQRSVQFWSVSMANKSSIVSDLHGWRTPSVSGEELQAPGKSGPQ